jgi:hypothetical protein
MLVDDVVGEQEAGEVGGELAGVAQAALGDWDVLMGLVDVGQGLVAHDETGESASILIY